MAAALEIEEARRTGSHDVMDRVNKNMAQLFQASTSRGSAGSRAGSFVRSSAAEQSTLLPASKLTRDVLFWTD